MRLAPRALRVAIPSAALALVLAGSAPAWAGETCNILSGLCSDGVTRCTSDEQCQGMDGGTDAGQPDAEMDAATDAAVDAPVDAAEDAPVEDAPEADRALRDTTISPDQCFVRGPGGTFLPCDGGTPTVDARIQNDVGEPVQSLENVGYFSCSVPPGATSRLPAGALPVLAALAFLLGRRRSAR